MRSIFAFAVVIAAQALAGCGMPETSVVAHDDSAAASHKAELEARSRIKLRAQVEAGTLGLAQLFPGGMPVEARHLPPLPRPMAVAMPVIPVHEARSSAAEGQVHLALAVTRGRSSGGCIYKPIMSDADIDACR